MSDVARRTGLAHSYVRSITKGKAGTVRNRTIEHVVQSMGIDAGFFRDPRADVSDYRRFLRQTRTQDGAAPTPTADVYDLVRAMDARELHAFRAWLLAWTDPSWPPKRARELGDSASAADSSDSSAPSTFYESEASR